MEWQVLLIFNPTRLQCNFSVLAQLTGFCSLLVTFTACQRIVDVLLNENKM